MIFHIETAVLSLCQRPTRFVLTLTNETPSKIVDLPNPLLLCEQMTTRYDVSGVHVRNSCSGTLRFHSVVGAVTFRERRILVALLVRPLPSDRDETNDHTAVLADSSSALFLRAPHAVPYLQYLVLVSFLHVESSGGLFGTVSPHAGALVGRRRLRTTHDKKAVELRGFQVVVVDATTGPC